MRLYQESYVIRMAAITAATAACCDVAWWLAVGGKPPLQAMVDRTWTIVWFVVLLRLASNLATVVIHPATEEPSA